MLSATTVFINCCFSIIARWLRSLDYARSLYSLLLLLLEKTLMVLEHLQCFIRYLFLLHDPILSRHFLTPLLLLYLHHVLLSQFTKLTPHLCVSTLLALGKLYAENEYPYLQACKRLARSLHSTHYFLLFLFKALVL